MDTIRNEDIGEQSRKPIELTEDELAHTIPREAQALLTTDRGAEPILPVGTRHFRGLLQPDRFDTSTQRKESLSCVRTILRNVPQRN
jgi:hypothetical protein